MSEKTISISKVPKNKGGGALRYKNGYRFCRGCNKFYQTTKKYCEVCGTILRTHPKRKGDKGYGI